MFRNALRPAVLPLLMVLLAAAAQAQPDARGAPPAGPDTGCVTGVARDFNALVPLLAEVQRDGREEVPGLVSRLNALRARITGAMDAAATGAESCETLARDLSAERAALQRLLPATAVAARSMPVVIPPAAAPAEALPAGPVPVAKAPMRPVERPAERRVVAPTPAPAPVKRAAYLSAPPAPRADPQLQACKTQVRQTHAEAQLQLQMAARSGRIVPQKLPDMQRAQSRLEGLSGAVRGDFETVSECQQLGQVLVQEVGKVQALVR
jgi:hypothetical protein